MTRDAIRDHMPMRSSPIDLSPGSFRETGHKLVDDIADFLSGIAGRPVAPNLSPAEVRAYLPAGGLPQKGTDPAELMRETAELLFAHSTLNGHPRFFGYITASPAPVGMLADFLAAAVNPNVGAWSLSPVATEIERQAASWLAELIGYPTSCGGLFVSGGNMANIVALVAARAARLPGEIRARGVNADGQRPVIYASVEAHTWVQKASDMIGIGSNAVHLVSVDERQAMNTSDLRDMIARDRAEGFTPFIVIGTAGTTATGAIDPLTEIAEICREESLWFHVDGAYGAPAAGIPGLSTDLAAIESADSVAVDPHKWLYSPVEAGCVLVRDGEKLRDAFAYHPTYYHFVDIDGEEPVNFYEWGPQNSRGFRALKVWLGLRQVGRDGALEMIAQDIALTREMYEAAAANAEIEAVTCNLSIVTMAYVPRDLRMRSREPAVTEYLNTLNETLLTAMTESGEAYLSNAVLDGRYLLRACIVNFRTGSDDVRAIPEIITRIGRETDTRLRPASLKKEA
ncbi:MAG TPA: aminotransferase class V-fold PLP-dependent enzyme [Gemmatimonadaceae bacterium]|nr:aminotransferase class V-fold PLP-dependent enzyme [Gemmatimonadaceae bacterium]